MRIRGNSGSEDIRFNLNQVKTYEYLNNTNFTTMIILNSGLRSIQLLNYTGNGFNVDLALIFN